MEAQYRDEVKKLQEHRQRTMELEATKKQKALMPKPPSAGTPQTASAKQYQRFQELLEKKLATPESMQSSPAPKTITDWAAPSPTAEVIKGNRPGQPTGPEADLPPLPAEATPAAKGSHKAKGEDAEIVPGKVLYAMYGYVAQQADELSFSAGDTIICVGSTPDEGWFNGICNQKSGLFPSNYVATAP